MGTVQVSLVLALLIIGFIARVVFAIVNYLTLKECGVIAKIEH